MPRPSVLSSRSDAGASAWSGPAVLLRGGRPVAVEALRLRSRSPDTLRAPTCSGLGALRIIGLILFGMLVGALTQLILGRQGKATDWSMAIVAGLVGSIVGAVLVTAIWRWARSRQRA